jgi:phage terminase large subunit
LDSARELEIEFNEEGFNDIFYELRKDFANPDLRFVFLYGGSSSSKTYTVCQVTILDMLEGASNNTMVLRKYGSDIRDSIYSDMKGIIVDWGLSDIFDLQQNFIRCTLTGSYCRFRGLDDSEKVKGLAGFKRVVMEEISQFEEDDLKQIRKRLRGKVNQQVIGIFNPINETHWLKVNLFDNLNLVDVPTDKDITQIQIGGQNNNFKVYLLTYLNNKWIVGPHYVDKHVISDFEFDKVNDYDYYRIYALGQWGKIKTGAEFYKYFDIKQHISIKSDSTRLVYDPNTTPLHVSFDENANPYLPCGVFLLQGLKLQQIDEIAMKHPLNSVDDICREIKRRYQGHRAGMYIYGDATSKKQDTKIERGYNFFRLIERELSEFKPVLRVPASNPSVIMRGNFINTVFKTGYGGIDLSIFEECILSIEDLQHVVEDMDGTKKKTKTKDKNTGVTFEKHGHFSDIFDYIVCYVFSEQFQEYLKGGKKEKRIFNPIIDNTKGF